MQYVGGRGDGVRTQIEAETGLLCSCHEAVGGSLVTRDIHVFTWHGTLALDAVGVRHTAVGVVTIVITGVNHLDIRFGNSWLFGKFLADKVLGNRG